MSNLSVMKYNLGDAATKIEFLSSRDVYSTATDPICPSEIVLKLTSTGNDPLEPALFTYEKEGQKDVLTVFNSVNSPETDLLLAGTY